MATSVRAVLARTRASAETALGSTRAPAWKDMKAKTANCVSSLPSVPSVRAYLAVQEQGKEPDL